MNSTDTGLAVSAAMLPLAMQLEAVPLPQSVPWWASLLMAAIGPACVAFVVHTGKTATMAIASYFRARADIKEKNARRMLSDNNPHNDNLARRFLVESRAERAAADSLEKAANELQDRKK
jgi:hypothetical protein